MLYRDSFPLVPLEKSSVYSVSYLLSPDTLRISNFTSYQGPSNKYKIQNICHLCMRLPLLPLWPNLNIFSHLDYCSIAYCFPTIYPGTLGGFLNSCLSDLSKHKFDQISCCLNFLNGYSLL